MNRHRLLALLALAGLACHSPAEPTENALVARVASVRIAWWDQKVLAVGIPDTLVAFAFDSTGAAIQDSLPFEWSSTNPSVIDVDQQGRVMPKAAGSATVYARVGTRASGTVYLRADVASSVFRVDPSPSRLLLGQRRSMVLQELARPVTVDVHGWVSSDPTVATVDDTGLVTGVRPGDVTITVSYAGTVFPAALHVAPDVTPLRFTAVAAAGSSTCALTADGAAYCWGSPAGGVLGTTESIDQCIEYDNFVQPNATVSYIRRAPDCALEPVRVDTPLRFVSLTMDRIGAACGTTAAGETYCWGATGDLSGRPDGPAVVPVSGQLRFQSFHFPCGVTTANEAWCFGDPTLRGTAASAATTPTQVPGGATWRMVTGGGSDVAHRCGVTTTDGVACWGHNSVGELGTGNTTASVTPVPVQSTERFSAVTVYSTGSCALTLDQRWFCWGSGQATPTLMSATLRFTALADHSRCALATDGSVYCSDFGGPLAKKFGNLSLVNIASGISHTCGVARDALAYCWGVNIAGAFGAGQMIPPAYPAVVIGQ